MRRKQYMIVFCTMLVLVLSLAAGVSAYKLAAKIETQAKDLSALEWLYPLQKVYDIKAKQDYFAIYSSDEVKLTYINRNGEEVDADVVTESQNEEPSDDVFWPRFSGELPEDLDYPSQEAPHAFAAAYRPEAEDEKNYPQGFVLLNENAEIIADGQVFHNLDFFGGKSKIFYGIKYVNSRYGNLYADDELIHGFFNLDGEMIVEIEEPVVVGLFSEGKVIIYETETVYCIDEQGHVLYEKPLSHGDEMVQSYYLMNGYVNGRIQLYDGWKCGIVDEIGNWLIEPFFHEIEIVDDFAIVTYGERMGILQLKK